MVLALAGQASLGAELSKEDLSKCRLPHGELVLPSRGSPGGRRGHILRFSDERLALDPFAVAGERPKSLKELFARMRRERTGDLMYSPLNDGTLIAVSGRIADLGRHYLYELNRKATE